MRLEYFQLIDRIVDLDLAQQTIRTEARVPTASTIFEGHFPGYPLMPGVLLIEAMAQTSGWLVIAVTKFSRMPFFAALKEAKLRSFVAPGQSLSLSAKLLHEGSGYAVTKADIRCDGKLTCNAEITFRLVEFPNPEFRASMEKMAAILEFPMDPRSWLMRRARSGSPASASCPASAKAPTRIGRASPNDESRSTPRPSLPTSSTRSCRSISTSRSRRKATSVRWSRGSGSAPTRLGSPSRMPA